MGIVQRQTLKNAIVNYTGILIGGLSTLFIYPLDWDLYGEIQFSLSTGILLSAIFSLGSHSLVNKYFPYFKINKINGFLSLVFIYSAINIVLVSIVLYLFRDPVTALLEFGGFDVNQLQDNLFVILPIGFLLVFITIFRLQCSNFGRIALPDVLSNFSLKLLVPLIVLLGYFSLVDFRVAGWILVGNYILITLAYIFYVKTLNGLDIKKGILKRVNRNKHIEMIRYMLYGAMNSIGNILVYKIDIVMIGLLLPISNVGYYSIFLFLSVVIEIPTKAIFQITGPIVSKSFEEGKMNEVKKLYTSASSSLYVIGIILFTAIWLNIDILFKIMTNGEDLVGYKYIFLLLALTKIIDMLTSINFHIISYSKFFRVNILFIVLLAISNIILNYFLINAYGIIGPAIATGISMLLFNLLKTLFILIKFKMHPFNWKIVIVTLFLIVAVFMPILFPLIFASALYSILLSAVFLTVFIIAIYRLHVSPEINKVIYKYWHKIFS